MQDAAALEVRPSRRPAVTAWRLRARELGRQIAAGILSEAEPEVAYGAAREIAEDIVETVKHSLRAEHGCTFDRLLDGIDVPQLSHRDGAGILKLVTDHPGATIAELGMAFAGRHDAAAMIGVRSGLLLLMAAGKVRCERKTFANKNRYYPLEP
jgi:hypothetical protein